jgi:hypothetical protein
MKQCRRENPAPGIMKKASQNVPAHYGASTKLRKDS